MTRSAQRTWWDLRGLIHRITEQSLLLRENRPTDGIHRWLCDHRLFITICKHQPLFHSQAVEYKQMRDVQKL